MNLDGRKKYLLAVAQLVYPQSVPKSQVATSGKTIVVIVVVVEETDPKPAGRPVMKDTFE